MATTIAPIDGMTSEQAGRAADRFQVRCRKEGSTLPKNMVQAVLEEEGDQLTDDMFTTLRTRVERRASVIIRRVRVNRTRSPQEILNATGRKQYTDPTVVDSMPKGEGEEVEVHFFKSDASAYDKNGWISDDNLEKQFELRGLKPADPYSVAAVNEADPAFADERPNGTHWQNADGKWCYSAFFHWDDERGVDVDYYDYGWPGGWWFAGLRK